MFCGNCGKPLESGAFCPYCGAKRPDVSPAPAAETVSQPEAENVNQPAAETVSQPEVETHLDAALTRGQFETGEYGLDQRSDIVFGRIQGDASVFYAPEIQQFIQQLGEFVGVAADNLQIFSDGTVGIVSELVFQRFDGGLDQ